MSYIFYNSYTENTSICPASVSGIDQEGAHRIREQARIERVKVVRQFLAILMRNSAPAPKPITTAAHFGGGSS